MNSFWNVPKAKRFPFGITKPAMHANTLRFQPIMSSPKKPSRAMEMRVLVYAAELGRVKADSIHRFQGSLHYHFKNKDIVKSTSRPHSENANRIYLFYPPIPPKNAKWLRRRQQFLVVRVHLPATTLKLNFFIQTNLEESFN